MKIKLTKRYVDLGKRVKGIVDLLPNAMNKSKHDGKKINNIEGVILRVESTYDQVLTGLVSLKKEDVQKNIDKLNEDYKAEKKAVESWEKTTGAILEVTNYEEAKSINSFHFIDIIIWIFLFAEGYLGFTLLQDYWNNGGLDDLKCGVVASIIMLIAFCLKKYMYLLPRATKYFVFLAFLLSAGAFIFQVSELRKSESLSEYLNNSSSSVSTSVEDSRKEFYFSLTLLTILLFGGLSLGIAKRDPRKEKSAENVIERNKSLIAYRDALDAYTSCRNEISKHQTQLVERGVEKYKLDALTIYLDGLQDNNSKSQARRDQELQVINTIKKELPF